MECINSPDELDNFELPQVDDALLMSFLDDTQVEDCDHEKLSSVIRSLEAEIDQHIMIDDDQNSSSEDNNWTSHLPDHGLDFTWMDMVPSSPSDGMASWFMEPCGDEMDGATEFGIEKDFYYFQHFDGISFEDYECGSCGTL